MAGFRDLIAAALRAKPDAMAAQSACRSGVVKGLFPSVVRRSLPAIRCEP